ncbi:MAG: hypothetical protein K2J15_05025 [Muribaculaceae bacterium]|nr:hypothetical protein [Muribaculaceae bacterium]
MKCLSDLNFRLLYRLAALLSLLIVAGCIKNEFTMEFHLPQACNDTYTVQYYASDKRGGIAVEAAVPINAGKGELKGITRNPTLICIYYRRHSLPACVAYAERGDRIVLEGEEENPTGWNVSGNKVNGRLSQFRRDNSGLINEAMTAPADKEKAIRERLNGAVKKYVESHNDDIASLILLATYYDAGVNPEDFLKLQSLLEKNGASPEAAGLREAIMRQDMMTSTRIAPLSRLQGGGGKIKDFIVKSFDKNLDTIRTSSGKRPILIYLWRRGDMDRQADIDTLKQLVKWRGDSARMPMVDICLDSDSISWTYALQGDSLRQVLHAWMPRGIADENLMQLGVNGSPWWIVIGPDGRLVMSTRDGKAAVKKFKTWKK